MTNSIAVSPGDVVAGKYRVERVLGVGGMGAVMSATHVRLGHKVALKFMHPGGMGDRDLVARFLREAQAAASLKSEHVTRVADMGELDDGTLYIVMEHLDGHDLDHLIQERGTVPPQEAAELVLQACDAIAEAHAAGIVHRDLKPANLFLTRRANGTPLVKVLDFGISKAKAPADAPSSMTQTNAMIGSPYYMSPEQMVSSRDVDASTDVWALGVILYQLVTGQVPFTADTIGGLVLKVHNEKAPPLPPLHLMNAPEFCALVDRCMDRDRTLRPTIGELVAALTRIRDAKLTSSKDSLARTTPDAASGGALGLSPLARSALPSGPALAPPIPSTTGQSWGATGARDGRKRRPVVSLVIGGGAVVLVGCGLALFLALRHPAPGLPSTITAAGGTSFPPPALVSAPEPAPLSPAAAPSTAASSPPLSVASSLPSAAPVSSARASATGTARTLPARTAAPARPPAVVNTGSAFDR